MLVVTLVSYWNISKVEKLSRTSSIILIEKHDV